MEEEGSHDSMETSRSGRLVSVLALVCAGCSVVAMVLALPVVFLTWMASDPTPTHMALVLWGLYGIPIAAGLVGVLSSNGTRYFTALAVGWGALGVSCVCASRMVPRYPAIGPHEWLAFLVFVAPACAACVGWVRCVSPAAQRVVMVAGPLAVVCTGAFSVWACWPGIHADIPISATEIRRQASHDFVGHNGSWGHAHLDDDAFRSFVRDEGLTEGGGLTWHVKVHAPEWFQPTEEWQCFTDAREDARSSEESWCWYRVWRHGEEMYFTSGCGWM